MRFRLLLAKTLGRTLQELDETMTAEEYGLWRALNTREPLDAAWWQTGLLASLQANINRGKNTKPYQVTDFIPTPWEQETQADAMTPDEFVRKHYG